MTTAYLWGTPNGSKVAIALEDMARNIAGP